MRECRSERACAHVRTCVREQASERLRVGGSAGGRMSGGKGGRVGVWECGSECSIECASAVVSERACAHVPVSERANGSGIVPQEVLSIH